MSKIYSAEHEAIKQVILDYVEAIYKVDPSRIEESVHADLTKRGFFKENEATEYTLITMTFTQTVELARRYNKDSKMPEDAPKDITIFDATDQIANAKLIAWWGTDYIHLAKYNSKWKIVNILWQAHPGQDSKLADYIVTELEDIHFSNFEEQLAKVNEHINAERRRRIEEEMTNPPIDDNN